MKDDLDALRATVSAYRAELLEIKAKLDATQTKLAEANRELAKAREEVEDLKRAYGEVCAVQEAERLERLEAAASTEKKAENLGLIIWGKL